MRQRFVGSGDVPFELCIVGALEDVLEGWTGGEAGGDQSFAGEQRFRCDARRLEFDEIRFHTKARSGVTCLDQFDHRREFIPSRHSLSASDSCLIPALFDPLHHRQNGLQSSLLPV